ncbi:hypothetical protein UPYG_G00245870 [Umbra pygmaea]|uniref:Transcriptional-regulating factor 1-like n=1 Tax=Umbra pygmaea TaxID=75934 RepID=A0ABD0WGG7_UMBPY
MATRDCPLGNQRQTAWRSEAAPMADRSSLPPTSPQSYQNLYLQPHAHLAHHVHPSVKTNTPCHRPLELYGGTVRETATRTDLPDTSPYSGGSKESYMRVDGGRGGYIDSSVNNMARVENYNDFNARGCDVIAQKSNYASRREEDEGLGLRDEFRGGNGSHLEQQEVVYNRLTSGGGNSDNFKGQGHATRNDEGCDGDDSSASGSAGDMYHRADESYNRDEFHSMDNGCRGEDVFYIDRVEEETDEGTNRDDVFYSRDYPYSGASFGGYSSSKGTTNHVAGDDRPNDQVYNGCTTSGGKVEGFGRDGGLGMDDFGSEDDFRGDGFGSKADDGIAKRDRLREVDDFCENPRDRRTSLDPPEAQIKPGWCVNASPPDQDAMTGEGRERGGGYFQDWASLHAYSQTVGGANGGRCGYPQKLDSFSEAFCFRRNIAGNRSSNESSGIGNFGFASQPSTRWIKTEVYDSLTESSTHPSPPHPHPFPLVLSPPPTPLPPTSLSPPKNTPPPPIGTFGPVQSSVGDDSGMVQFYSSSLQQIHSSHPSAVMWKLPLSQWLQQSGDISVVEGNVTFDPSSSTYVYSEEAVFPGIQAPAESSFSTSSLLQSSVSVHSPVPVVPQQKGAVALVVYRGLPFPSLVLSQRRGAHYSPPPMLKPQRRGTGLLCAFLPSSIGEREMGSADKEDGWSILPCINVGPDFQAELPSCRERREESGAWSEEASANDELMWKPWEELENSAVIQKQVEAVLSVCSSSCLPGGGSNTELALHCLYRCHGDTVATVEKLLFSTPSSTGDYHYAGSHVWLQSEQALFSKALTTHGKDFALIQRTVQTKSVSQCVEFYYLSKRLGDKQRQQREQERRMDGQTNVAGLPNSVEGVVPAPSLATSFPCKQCGKMFYKIKSRNAHMKIHRQQQDEWRHPGHGLNLAQNLSSNLGTNLPHHLASSLAYRAGSAPTSNNNSHQGPQTVVDSNNINKSVRNIPKASVVTNSNIVTAIDSSSIQRAPPPVLSLHQSWNSFQVNSDPAQVFYYDPDVKGTLEVTGGGVKGQISWQ